jgi:hypothetical protein
VLVDGLLKSRARSVRWCADFGLIVAVAVVTPFGIAMALLDMGGLGAVPLGFSALLLTTVLGDFALRLRSRSGSVSGAR